MSTRNQQSTIAESLIELIHIEGMIRTPVISNGWHTSIAIFTVVSDGLKTLIGCHLFDQLGFAITGSPSQQGKQIINISPHRAFKEKLALQIPDLTCRMGRLKNHA